MKQTAVEYIDEYLRHKGIIIEDKNIPQVLIGIINEAKDIEKKQIVDAYDVQWNPEIKNGMDYYNKTYKK
jgi:hypothetical protein